MTVRFFDYYQDYINSTLGAAHGLAIEYFDDFGALSSRRDYHEQYRNFIIAVDHYLIQIRIRHSRRAKRYSVELDLAAKEKIRHYLAQLKELVEQLAVTPKKREAIFNKILALESELSRDRTRFDIVAAFILEGSAVAGESAEKLEPWRKWIDSIAKVIGFAKEKDAENPSIPLPEDTKRIEPPKRRLPPPESIDDDIPF
jgi:hypothetical protein